MRWIRSSNLKFYRRQDRQRMQRTSKQRRIEDDKGQMYLRYTWTWNLSFVRSNSLFIVCPLLFSIKVIFSSTQWAKLQHPLRIRQNILQHRLLYLMLMWYLFTKHLFCAVFAITISNNDCLLCCQLIVNDPFCALSPFLVVCSLLKLCEIYYGNRSWVLTIVNTQNQIECVNIIINCTSNECIVTNHACTGDQTSIWITETHQLWYIESSVETLPIHLFYAPNYSGMLLSIKHGIGRYVGVETITNAISIVTVTHMSVNRSLRKRNIFSTQQNDIVSYSNVHLKQDLRLDSNEHLWTKFTLVSFHSTDKESENAQNSTAKLASQKRVQLGSAFIEQKCIFAPIAFS